METVGSDGEGPDFVCEEEYPEKSTDSHAAYLITVPSPTFLQKTVYTYGCE
jgi:hypothetical protein